MRGSQVYNSQKESALNWTTAQANAALKRAGAPDALQQACGEPPKRSKHGNVPTYYDGIRFASKLESRHYMVLKVMESRGSITHLELQPRFPLQEKFTDSCGKTHRAIEYRPDFAFIRDGAHIAIDSKGTETPMFKLKLKLFVKKYPNITLERWTK